MNSLVKIKSRLHVSIEIDAKLKSHVARSAEKLLKAVASGRLNVRNVVRDARPGMGVFLRQIYTELPANLLRHVATEGFDRGVRSAWTASWTAAVTPAKEAGLAFPVPPRFKQLSPTLWAGSRLDQGKPMDVLSDVVFAPLPTYDMLREQGVKSIISLRPEDAAEIAPGAAGFQNFSLPVADHQAPSAAQMKAFVALVTRPENQPAYVHGDAGRCRTACMAVAYGMAVLGQSQEEALAANPIRPFTDAIAAELQAFAASLESDRAAAAA